MLGTIAVLEVIPVTKVHNTSTWLIIIQANSGLILLKKPSNHLILLHLWNLTSRIHFSSWCEYLMFDSNPGTWSVVRISWFMELGASFKGTETVKFNTRSNLSLWFLEYINTWCFVLGISYMLRGTVFWCLLPSTWFVVLNIFGSWCVVLDNIDIVFAIALGMNPFNQDLSLLLKQANSVMVPLP